MTPLGRPEVFEECDLQVQLGQGPNVRFDHEERSAVGAGNVHDLRCFSEGGLGHGDSFFGRLASGPSLDLSTSSDRLASDPRQAAGAESNCSHKGGPGALPLVALSRSSGDGALRIEAPGYPGVADTFSSVPD